MKTIYFLAPEKKWGPYYIYKDIVDYINDKFSDKYKAILCNSKTDYFMLHFKKVDYIISVIPFLFKPLWVKKYYFNPRWNWEIEKKKNSLWNKLQYLSPLNLWFCDKIILPSLYLADKLWFKNKYTDKIYILPNFIELPDLSFSKNKINVDEYTIKIITITSFKFFEKGIWILNLANVIKLFWEELKKRIIWTIVWNDESDNFLQIKKNFDKICFPSNVEIVWKWWLKKDEVNVELKKNDIFLYWTYLDNFPNILLQAMSFGLPILSNNFESLKYFLKNEMLCTNEEEMVNKIFEILSVNYYDFVKISLDTSTNFVKEKILSECVYVLGQIK